MQAPREPSRLQRCLPFVAAAIYIGVLCMTGSVTVFRLCLALPVTLLVWVGVSLRLESQRGSGGLLPTPREWLVPLEDDKSETKNPPSKIDPPLPPDH